MSLRDLAAKATPDLPEALDDPWWKYPASYAVLEQKRLAITVLHPLAPEMAVLLADTMDYVDGSECEGYPVCTLTGRCDRCSLLARFADLEGRT